MVAIWLPRLSSWPGRRAGLRCSLQRARRTVHEVTARHSRFARRTPEWLSNMLMVLIRRSRRPALPHEDGEVWPAAEPAARSVRERVGLTRARDVVCAHTRAVQSRQPVHHPPRVMPAGMCHAELPRVIPHRPCPARSPTFGRPPATSKPYRRRAVHHLRCVSNLGMFSGATLLLECHASRTVTGL